MEFPISCLSPGGLWSSESLDIWADDLIGRRFEQVAQSFPENIACCGQEKSVTFSELDRSANDVARFLCRSRGDCEEPIAVLTEHGPAFLEAILGVLKAGKICTPLDPCWPAARLAGMLDDSGAKLLLANVQNQELALTLAGSSCEVALLDSMRHEGRFATPDQEFSPDRLAYLLYTSGSTGKPKGIVHSHRTALHNIGIYKHVWEIDSNDRVTWLHSPSFSSAWAEILVALLNGAQVCPWDVRSRGSFGLADWMERYCVTILNWVPSAFRQFVATLPATSPVLPTPRLLVLGSEPVTKRDWELFCRHFPEGSQLINRLGATEVNCYRILRLDKSAEPRASSLPAGYAVPGKDVVLIDELDQPVEVGQAGQIVVSSRYCTPGYWRLYELTQTVIQPDASNPRNRLFRTGDLGILHPDGCLEYLGRMDNQIKLRGHRIEIGEIEHVLVQHASIQEAAVACPEIAGGDPRLVAYIVARDADFDVGILRQFLGSRLPDYMIPTQFVRLSRLPTTESGKIDRRALPAPPDMSSTGTANSAVPRNAIEAQFLEIWSEALGRRPIGVDENFFELGGQSLLAMQVIAQIRSIFNIQLSLRNIFEAPTVAALAHLAILEGARYIPLVLQRLPVSVPVLHLGLDGCHVWPPRYLTLEQQVAAYVAALETAKVSRKAVLVGYSYGGILAYMLAEALLKQGWEQIEVSLIEPAIPARYLPIARQFWKYLNLTLWKNLKQSWVGDVGRFALGRPPPKPPAMDSRGIPDYGGRWGQMLAHYQSMVRNASLVPLGRRIGLAGTRKYQAQDLSCWRQIERGGVDPCILPIEAGHLDCFRGDSGIRWVEFLECAYNRLTSPDAISPE